MPRKSPIPVDPTDIVLSKLMTLRDTIGSITDDDRDSLASWERMIKTHALRRAWMQNPITQEVFRKLEGMVVDQNRKLSTDEGMSDEERRSIFKGKAAFMWLLSLFSDAKDDAVLGQLEEEIEQRTREFDEFNTNLTTL